VVENTYTCVTIIMATGLFCSVKKSNGSIVEIPSSLKGICDWFVKSSGADTRNGLVVNTDIHVKKEDDTISYITCIHSFYDTRLNKFSGKRDGPLLFINSIVDKDDAPDMKDHILPFKHSEDYVKKVITGLSYRLRDHFYEDDPSYSVCDLISFPSLTKYLDGDGDHRMMATWMESCTCRNKMVEFHNVDILTMRIKKRKMTSCTVVLGTDPDDENEHSKFILEELTRPENFCCVCGEVSIHPCTSCGFYYACNKMGCAGSAWKTHKGVCGKNTNPIRIGKKALDRYDVQHVVTCGDKGHQKIIVNMTKMR